MKTKQLSRREESIALTDVDVAQSSQALAELFNLGLVGLGLVALLVLGAALLLNVEPEVLQQDNGAVVGLVDNGLNLGADAVGGKGDRLAQELLELRNNRLEGVLGVDSAIGASEVGHQDDSLGAIVEGVLDGGDGTDNALGVGDVLVLIEGHVEVDLDKHNTFSQPSTSKQNFGYLPSISPYRPKSARNWPFRRRCSSRALTSMLKAPNIVPSIFHHCNGGAIRTHPNQDPLALDVDVGDGQLVGERHFGWILACEAEQGSRCKGRRCG